MLVVLVAAAERKIRGDVLGGDGLDGPPAKGADRCEAGLSGYSSQLVEFGHEHILGFFPFRIDLNTLDRTDDLTLRLAMVPDAFGALGRVDFIEIHPHIDGFIGTLRFADVAVDAFIGNQQGHDSFGVFSLDTPLVYANGRINT